MDLVGQYQKNWKKNDKDEIKWGICDSFSHVTKSHVQNVSSPRVIQMQIILSHQIERTLKH